MQYPRVDRSSMVTVRMVRVFRPGTLHRPEGAVSLRASEVGVFDGRTVAALHQRMVTKFRHSRLSNEDRKETSVPSKDVDMALYIRTPAGLPSAADAAIVTTALAAPGSSLFGGFTWRTLPSMRH